MIKIHCTLLIFFTLFYFSASSAETLKFDRKLLEANGISAAQLDNALNRHVIPQGYSETDIYVNGKYITTGSVFWQNGTLYYEKEIKEKSGITSNVWHRTDIRHNHRQFYHLDKVFSVAYDRLARTLKLSGPAQYLNVRDGKNRISGGTGAFVNYSAYGYHFSAAGQPVSSLNVDYETGMNAANVVIRAHGTYSEFRSRQSATRYSTVRDGYAERDLGSFRVRVGRTVVSDGGFGTGYIDGAIVSSATGYHQAFVNFDYDANEVLTVEFLQNNLLLWKETVQKGHASLRNIPVADLTNDVTVLIRRNGQVIESRLISRAQISTSQDGLPGYYAFSGVRVGDKRMQVAGGGYSKRFSDRLQPSVAAVTTARYRAISLSNTLETGRLRSSQTFIFSHNEAGEAGSSVNLDATISHYSLSHTRNSRQFSYLGQGSTKAANSLRSSTGLVYSSRLSERVSGNLAFTHYNFYDSAGFDSVSAGLNLSLPHASVGVNLAYMSLAPGHSEKDKFSMNLALNVPLRWGSGRSSWRSQYYHYADTSRFINSLSAGISDDYTLTASHTRTTGAQQNETFSVDNSVTTPYTSASLSLSQTKQNSQSYLTSAAYVSGSIAASRHGVIFSPSPISDTWAIVDTGVSQYLKVSSLQGGGVTNHDGKVIISPVRANMGDFIRVNPEGLPKGVIISNNIREFSAVRGAVPYFRFSTYRNRLLLMKWTNKPSWVHQNDVFYDRDGKMLARFIDRDVLLISEGDVQKIEHSGMASPADINVKCRLSPGSLKKKEKIKNVMFTCSNS